jgi:hypothetical protein
MTKNPTRAQARKMVDLTLGEYRKKIKVKMKVYDWGCFRLWGLIGWYGVGFS